MLSKKTLVVLLLSFCFISVIPLAVAGPTDDIDVELSYFGPYWDINHDGVTNYLDASILVNRYGQSGTPGWVRADIVRDGDVDGLDVSSFVFHYLEGWLVP